MLVWITGASRRSASAASAAAARRAPPPARMTGRAARARRAAASARSGRAGAGTGGGSGRRRAGKRHHIGRHLDMDGAGPARGERGEGKVQTSCPAPRAWRSGNWGRACAPCRPDRAVRAAGPCPCPRLSRRFTPEMTRIGTESSRACAIAVSVLVRPGPGDHEGHPRFARDPGIAIGHEGRALFVARGDVADRADPQGRGKARSCGRRGCRTQPRPRVPQVLRPVPVRLSSWPGAFRDMGRDPRAGRFDHPSSWVSARRSQPRECRRRSFRRA